MLVPLLIILVWFILAVWIIGCILAAGWPEERPPVPADPYAAEAAVFRAELADWDRRGRP